MNKKYILLLALSLVLVAGNLLIKDRAQAQSKSNQVVQMDAQYAADFSNDEVLMGASHNVFVGKVIRQSGTQERGIGPETQYEVKVVDNIKGDLRDVVIVDQQGGYKGGVLYVMNDDTSTATNKDSYLLQPGKTYLLATRYNSDEDWYTLNSHPNASKLLSADANADDAVLKNKAESDEKVAKLKNAYTKEVLIDADVKNNNARNSFISVQKKEAEAKQKDQNAAPASEYVTTTTEAL